MDLYSYPIDITPGMDAGFGYEPYTCIGAVAGILEQMGPSDKVVIRRVITNMMSEMKIGNIRKTIQTIQKATGTKYTTRKTPDGLLVVRVD